MAIPRRDLSAIVSGRYEWTPHLPPEWYGDALCAQIDPEPFFPEKGGSTRASKKVCAACPVREKCLQYALDNGERFGIWGGVSERDRRKILRDRRAPDRAAC